MEWDFPLPAPETEKLRKIHCSSLEDGPPREGHVRHSVVKKQGRYGRVGPAAGR